jgi:hypothetical protein
MSDEEAPNWTLEEHVAAGATALAKINADRRHIDAQPICHHFEEMNPVDPILVSVTETYRDLCPRFATLGVEFLPDRLEAWETTRPDLHWLSMRIPAIWQASTETGLVYRGWTWEPRSGQPISASDITVINNRSL